jgi:Rrf2 family protein
MTVLNETTLAAIKTLLYLALRSSDEPAPPRQIAEDIDLSPTYSAKITARLVRAGILRAHRGAKGGVSLGKVPADITLLEVVEACQGKALGHYCQETKTQQHVCAFHRAMHELHNAITGVLEHWTIADLQARPNPSRVILGQVECRMAGAATG